MKTQITSILLCALLSSTLCHEYLSARHFAHEARSSNHLSHFQARDAAPSQQCEWICNSTSNNTVGGLQIIVNETTSLVGIVNVTANVAVVIDINANLVAIFNGNSGVAIIVNIQTGSGVYIAAGQSTSVWLSAKINFEVYFASLTSLQVILDLKVGTQFEASTVTSEILEILGELLGHLSYQLGLEIQGNIKDSLTIFLRISSSLYVVLKGPLEGILKFGQGLIHIHGDILWLVSVFEGLGIFFSEVNGGLAALIAAKVELDLALLLAASNGIELLVNLLLAIVARVDLSIVSGLLNSSSQFLAVIVKLGGNVSGGLSGMFKVVADIVALINGNSTIDIVIISLLEYSASGSTDIDIFVHIEGLLKVIEIQSTVYSSTQLSAFILFVQNLQNGKWVVGGINISEIITILLKGSVNGALLLVVTILLRLTAAIKVSIAISALLYNLLLLLQTNVGVHLLLQIISGLSINVDLSTGGNILQQIFSKIDVSIILGLLTKGVGIEVILKAIPVMGPIFISLSGVVSTASKGSLSLTTILTASDAHSVVIEIETFIKSSINVSSSTTSSTTSTTKSGGGWTWGIGGGGSGGSNGSVSTGGSGTTSTTKSGGGWTWGIGGGGSGGSNGSVSIGGSGTTSTTKSGGGWTWSIGGGGSGGSNGSVSIGGSGTASVTESDGGSETWSIGGGGSGGSNGSGSIGGSGTASVTESDGGSETWSIGGGGSGGSSGSGSIGGSGTASVTESGGGSATWSIGGGGSGGSNGSGSIGGSGTASVTGSGGGSATWSIGGGGSGGSNGSGSIGGSGTASVTESGGGSATWSIGGGGSGGSIGSGSIGGSGSGGSGYSGGSWSIGGRHHGHHKQEKSGHVNSHNNKLQEKKHHQREHYQSN